MKGNGIFAVIFQIGGDRMMLEGAGKETLTYMNTKRDIWFITRKKKLYLLHNLLCVDISVIKP